MHRLGAGTASIRLRMSRTDVEPQDAAAYALAEALARELCERLDVKVLLRPRYTLRDLWDPLTGRLQKHSTYFAAHSEAIEGLRANSWVRNECGAHSNPTPAPVSPGEVDDLRSAAARLYRSVWCKDCCDFVQADRTEKEEWRCGCGALTYATGARGGSSAFASSSRVPATH
jgi:hypothetical protein